MDIKDTDLPMSTGQILCGTRTFKDVEPESIRRLVENSELRVVAAGDALFRAGDAYQQNIFVLVNGNIVSTSPSGRQVTYLPGEFIGLANYLDDNDQPVESPIKNLTVKDPFHLPRALIYAIRLLRETST